MSVTEGFAPYGEYQTWYRITGDLKSGKPPLVVVHGGPGCTHDYVDSYKDVAKSGRAVVHYDQVGNGKSPHLPEKGGDFWTVEFFKAELHNLIDHLGIRDAYCVLGQSWGGMLGSEFAVDRPEGLKALVIANSPASLKTWVAEANRLRRALPGGVHETLLKHEEAGTTDSAEYKAATDVFNRNHVCRIVPMPPEVQRTFDASEADPTVYYTMNGPNEFHVVGTMKEWSIEGRLHTIDVPVYLVSGRHDEATQACVTPFLDEIPDVRWTVFGNSSHMPHVEERPACMAAVTAFLDEKAG